MISEVMTCYDSHVLGSVIPIVFGVRPGHLCIHLFSIPRVSRSLVLGSREFFRWLVLANGCTFTCHTIRNLTQRLPCTGLEILRRLIEYGPLLNQAGWNSVTPSLSD